MFWCLMLVMSINLDEFYHFFNHVYKWSDLLIIWWFADVMVWSFEGLIMWRLINPLLMTYQRPIWCFLGLIDKSTKTDSNTIPSEFSSYNIMHKLVKISKYFESPIAMPLRKVQHWVGVGFGAFIFRTIFCRTWRWCLWRMFPSFFPPSTPTPYLIVHCSTGSDAYTTFNRSNFQHKRWV